MLLIGTTILVKHDLEHTISDSNALTPTLRDNRQSNLHVSQEKVIHVSKLHLDRLHLAIRYAFHSTSNHPASFGHPHG